MGEDGRRGELIEGGRAKKRRLRKRDEGRKREGGEERGTI